VQVGHRSVRIEAKIAEGGYAFVYRVTDVNTFAKYALKRMAV
jgi:predicted transcriptional regulator